MARYTTIRPSAPRRRPPALACPPAGILASRHALHTGARGRPPAAIVDGSCEGDRLAFSPRRSPSRLPGLLDPGTARKGRHGPRQATRDRRFGHDRLDARRLGGDRLGARSGEATIPRGRQVRTRSRSTPIGRNGIYCPRNARELLAMHVTRASAGGAAEIVVSYCRK